jgi:hypothetical protein
MEHACRHDPDLDLIEVTTSGRADPPGLMRMLADILEMARRQPTAAVLVDHSALDTTGVGMEVVEQLSSTAGAEFEILDGRRVAHVVTTDLQYGLVRAWETMTALESAASLAAMTFRSRAEALAWLAK